MLFNMEERIIIPNTALCSEVFPVTFGKNFQRFLEFSPRMSEVSDNPDLLRKLVAPGIPVGMQISSESLEECLRMFSAPRFLAFIEYQLLFRLPSGSVEPHVALALGFSARFIQHLQCGFIRMTDILFQQFPVHYVPDWLQPELKCFQQPV